jgi:hypothetical protein
MATIRFGAITSGKLHNFEATAAPTAANDVGEGYAVGSLWVDVTADLAYVCVDSTENTAVWAIMAVPAITPSVEDWGDVTNSTEDRTLDCNATTLDEVADILATLISDLVATGILVAPA